MASSQESKSADNTGNNQKSASQNNQKGDTGSKRGFAAMNGERQRQIASKGGQAAHQKGTAHEFDSEEARRAGQKGGEAVSRNRDHMAEIGRKGGESRQAASRDERSSSSRSPAAKTAHSGPEIQTSNKK